MTRWRIALAFAAMTQTAAAQEITGEEHLNLTGRPDGYSLVRVSVRRAARAYAGELSVRSVTGWPYAEAMVRMPLRVPPMAQRDVFVPLPLGPNDSVNLSLEGEGLTGQFSATGTANQSGAQDVSFVAIVGLGERVAFEFGTAVRGFDIVGGAARGGDDPTDVVLPTVPSAWGGVNVVIAGSEGLLRATPEGRTALGQWVLLGGVLAISPRTTADLRDPWIASMVGPVEDAPGASRTYTAMSVDEHALASRRMGLGSVHVLPMDLSLGAWNTDPNALAEFQRFARSLGRAGGGVFNPGELGMFRKATEIGAVQNVLRPFVNLRPILLPIAALWTLYIIAVGVMLGGAAGRRAPLRRLLQLPLVALATLGLVVATSTLTRSGRTSSRVMAIYDLPNGGDLAMRRVLAGLTAGRSLTFDLPSPEGTLAVFRAGSAAANGVLRWDGARTSIERARLGLFETGIYYVEGPARTGAITVTLGPDRTPTVRNGTRMTLLEARYESPFHGTIWEFDRIAPGASATATRSHTWRPGQRTERLWSIGSFLPQSGPRNEQPDLRRVLLDEVIANPSFTPDAGALWALAEVPEDLRALIPGFAVEKSAVLVRVVVRSERDEPAVAHSRVGVRSYANSEREDTSAEAVPEPVAVERTGDGGVADASIAALLQVLGATDAAVHE